MTINNELKIMHACELGAVGVYRGHKCVARYFYRINLAELDSMRFHEKSHVEIFQKELNNRNARACHFSGLFFLGGLFYGVFVGLFGLKAIGVSTNTVESIVVNELNEVLCTLDENSDLYRVVKKVQLEELEHKDSGRNLAGDSSWITGFVSTFAKFCAYSAKHMASVL